MVSGFGITTTTEVIEISLLPDAHSAQQAKLKAVARACELGKGKKIHIYTGSWYAFGVTKDFGMLWKHWGLLTSSGQPIKNQKQVSHLLDYLLLPQTVAVTKIPGHSREKIASMSVEMT